MDHISKDVCSLYMYYDVGRWKEVCPIELAGTGSDLAEASRSTPSRHVICALISPILRDQ